MSSFIKKAPHNSCGQDSRFLSCLRAYNPPHGQYKQAQPHKTNKDFAGAFSISKKTYTRFAFFLLNIKNVRLHKQPKVVIYFVSILKVRIAVHEHTEWILLVSHNAA